MSCFEFENTISLAQEVNSSMPTRWERKRQQALSQSQNTDRYIPNRSGTDFDLSFQAGGADDSEIVDDNNNTSDYAKLLAANTNGKNVDFYFNTYKHTHPSIAQYKC